MSTPSPSSSSVPPPLVTFPPRSYIRIKVVSLGDAGVGKSCLIKRYCEKKFIPKYISTIGVDFGVRQVNHQGKETKVNFWDLSGSPDFFSVRNEFHSHAEGTLLVFDVASVSSFHNLSLWVDEHHKFGGQPKIVVVCANKTDGESGKRVVSEADGRKFADKNGYKYFETSAKSGQNVNEIFETLFTGIANAAGQTHSEKRK